jgi:predicted AlkP superfamily pyrophosphatase or phosphodiesterase
MAMIIFLVDVGAGYAGSLQNVIVISLDALHPHALQKANIPTLLQLMESGTYTLKGRSTDPPKTLIAHTAMFTGLSPEESGKVDNDWTPGEASIDKETIFDSAKQNGFKTGFFYSKEKLGYLINRAVDVHEWSRDYAIDSSEAFIKTPGRHFVFLHVSGLDQVGPQYGWLSPEYLEELSFIDDYLSSLINSVIGKRNFLLVVTSDHAGHGKIHGSDHQEDYRLPLIVYSDTISVNLSKNQPFLIIDFKKRLEGMIN